MALGSRALAVAAEAGPLRRVDLAGRTARRRNRATATALAVLAVVVVVGGWFLAAHSGEPTSTASSGSSAASPVDVGSVASTSGDPSSALEARRRADRSDLVNTEGSWLPQVSSKKVGLVADGTTYDEAAIWTQFQSTLASHPEARLANSSDWSSFRQGSYWVTVIDQPFPTPAQANAWCDSEGYAVDQCYAKRLTTSGSYTGNTVTRH